MQKLRKTDLYWLLAYPLYQLVGTLRHESGHAIAARLAGARIIDFVWFPAWLPDRGFTWGYVRWTGHTGWLVLAAPYIADLITFLLFYYICTHVRFRSHWVWVNFVIFGMFSPLANSLYAYLRAGNPYSDVGRLMILLPQPALHSYFILTLLLYILGLGSLLPFKRRKTIPQQPARDQTRSRTSHHRTPEA